MAEAVQVHVEDRDVGPEPDGGLERVQADRARSEDDQVAGRHAGDAREEDPAAAVGLAEVVGALLDGQAPGDLAHRRQERQAPVRPLHRLVGEGDHVRPAEDLGQRRRGGEVEVGEEDLARAEPRVFGVHRLLDLQDELRLAPDLLDAGQPGSDRAVVLVADPAAGPGSPLQQDPVAGLGEGADARRRQRDALLARLDLAGDTDDHAPARWLRG